jgi:hypothetical protein
MWDRLTAPAWAGVGRDLIGTAQSRLENESVIQNEKLRSVNRARINVPRPCGEEVFPGY